MSVHVHVTLDQRASGEPLTVWADSPAPSRPVCIRHLPTAGPELANESPFRPRSVRALPFNYVCIQSGRLFSQRSRYSAAADVQCEVRIVRYLLSALCAKCIVYCVL